MFTESHSKYFTYRIFFDQHQTTKKWNSIISMKIK